MKLTLNLASRTYLNRRALYGVYAVLTTVLVLLLALNLGLYLRSQAHARQIRDHLAEIEKETGGTPAAGSGTFTPAAYEKVLEQIRFANEILDQDSYRWTALLNRLEEVVPERVAIGGIQPDYKGKTLNLTGQARRVEDLQRFLDNLIGSPDFSDVYLLQQAQVAPGGNGDGAGAISFSIVVKGAF